jgi:hypothetical protein
MASHNNTMSNNSSEQVDLNTLTVKEIKSFIAKTCEHTRIITKEVEQVQFLWQVIEELANIQREIITSEEYIISYLSTAI